MHYARRRVARRPAAAFTLVELLVVISIIALLISILLPSLKKAREQTKSVVCLANLKSLSTGVLIYASEYNGVLPGHLHPAVYREQTLQVYLDRGYSEPKAKFARDRQLSWMLHTTLGQRGESLEKNVTDDVATCPALAGIVPDEHFDRWDAANGQYVFPTHYVLNNHGARSGEEQQGFTGNLRETEPPYYFGLSPYDGATFQPTPPVPLSRIRRTSDEWMLADAWHRSRTGSLTEYQQEGPYQYVWSGNALPHFAPHFKKGSKAPILDTDERALAAASVRAAKSDGRTNTAYFDGHADPVISKTFKVGEFDMLYGFKGTVNGHLSASTKMILKQVGGGIWE